MVNQNPRISDAPNLAPPTNIDTAILLASVQRAVTHVETLAAATATESSRRKVTLFPMSGTTADEFVLVTGISTQGVDPRSIGITVKDLNRANFRLLMTPDLTVPDLVLIGDASEGIVLTLESYSGAQVPITIRAATIKRAEFEAIFGGLRRIQVQALQRARGLR